ncbi:MAG: hypothetical protein IKL05_02220 [Clostridia bacterium]|nr:hypothetical protein [Clostridia bacterium]
MPVYVYSDSWKTDCIGVLEDDGHFYDRKFNYLDSSPRMSHFLGSVSSSGCVYSDPQRIHQIGVIDDYGKIYRGWNILTNIPAETAPLGCMEGDKVYRGNSTWGEYPAAYLDGDGDYRAAAAAAILFVLCKDSSGDDGEVWTPSDDSYTPRYSGGGGGGGTADPGFVKGCLITIAICVLIFFFACGDEWREKDEAYKEWDEARHEAVMDALEEKREKEKIANTLGWVMLGDNYGRYRASFLNENANDTFTFTYTVGGNSTVSFEVTPDYRDLKLSSYILYNGQEYNIRSTFDLTPGDQIVVIVEQKGGTGYFNIYAYEN